MKKNKPETLCVHEGQIHDPLTMEQFPLYIWLQLTHTKR